MAMRTGKAGVFAQLRARGPTLNPNTSVRGDQMEPLIFICSLLLEKNKNHSIPFDISHVAEIGSLSGAEQMEKRLSAGQMMYTGDHWLVICWQVKSDWSL